MLHNQIQRKGKFIESCDSSTTSISDLHELVSIKCRNKYSFFIA